MHSLNKIHYYAIALLITIAPLISHNSSEAVIIKVSTGKIGKKEAKILHDIHFGIYQNKSASQWNKEQNPALKRLFEQKIFKHPQKITFHVEGGLDNKREFTKMTDQQLKKSAEDYYFNNMYIKLFRDTAKQLNNLELNDIDVRNEVDNAVMDPFVMIDSLIEDLHHQGVSITSIDQLDKLIPHKNLFFANNPRIKQLLLSIPSVKVLHNKGKNWLASLHHRLNEKLTTLTPILSNCEGNSINKIKNMIHTRYENVKKLLTTINESNDCTNLPGNVFTFLEERNGTFNQCAVVGEAIMQLSALLVDLEIVYQLLTDSRSTNLVFTGEAHATNTIDLLKGANITFKTQELSPAEIIAVDETIKLSEI